jgi:hypothetical protein
MAGLAGLSLMLKKHNAMQMYGGGEKAPRILKLGISNPCRLNSEKRTQ